MTPEGKVKHKVKAFLKGVGAWYYMPVSNGMGRHGCPDFLVCWEGRFYAIETKAPGKKDAATPNQLREIAAVKLAGGCALVIDDVEQLRKVFTNKQVT